MASSRPNEAGFALYMALGFIVLISTLVGSLGTRLNTGLLTEARRGDTRAVLDEAETALSQGWHRVYDEYINNGLTDWPNGATSATDAAVNGDRTSCLASRTSDKSSYFASVRTGNGDNNRRYFVKKNANSYIIFGCAFRRGNMRAATAVYNVGLNTFTLQRLRRY